MLCLLIAKISFVKTTREESPVELANSCHYNTQKFAEYSPALFISLLIYLLPRKQTINSELL